MERDALGSLIDTIPFGCIVFERQASGQFLLIGANRIARDIASLTEEPALPLEVIRTFNQVLSGNPRELQLNAAQLDGKGPFFLARVFRLSATIVCVHMHDAQHPLVLYEGLSKTLAAAEANNRDAKKRVRRPRSPPIKQEHDRDEDVGVERHGVTVETAAPAIEGGEGGQAFNLDSLALRAVVWTLIGVCVAYNGACSTMFDAPTRDAFNVVPWVSIRDREHIYQALQRADTNASVFVRFEHTSIEGPRTVVGAINKVTQDRFCCVMIDANVLMRIPE